MTEFVAAHGMPPPHFHRPPGVTKFVTLPLQRRSGGLYDVLLKRKTTRAFDSDYSLPLNSLAVILYYVFGCQGYCPIHDNIVGLKKTSPSGGDLHPTEVYLLVRNVDGLRAGIYHYNVETHDLGLLQTLTREDASQLANEFTAGQSFPSLASVLFLMTTRFRRNFWKYGKHPRAYGVLLMDAAHLSQTFYLVCAELGLGSFFTAAVNGANIERRLGLDPFLEGAVGVLGCGRPANVQTGLEPHFLPYTAVSRNRAGRRKSQALV